MPEVSFPKPQSGDSEDVAWALETASALWARGDAREAIRWIRRAAETASDQGSDERAVALARTAADLATELKIPPSMPPPAPGDGGVSKTRQGGPKRSLSSTAISASGGGGDRRGPPEVGVKPPIDDGTRVEVGGALTDPEPTIREEGDELDEHTIRTDRDGDIARLIQSGKGAATTVRTRQALRVSVTPSDERGVLVVRVLGEDEMPPTGSHEAMLVAVEAGAHLLAKKR